MKLPDRNASIEEILNFKPYKQFGSIFWERKVKPELLEEKGFSKRNRIKNFF